MVKLGPEAARIFRITHVKNVPWILDHGVHCKSSPVIDPTFEQIGLTELIAKRTARTVPIGPGGSLSDYVPFYFTPWSVMMYNIKTGHNGVVRRSNDEIVILVSSLHQLQKLAVPFVFTDGHAYMQESDFYESVSDLDKIDWPLLRNKSFKRDPEDPGKVGRYQAEALVHRRLPVEALLGIACYDPATESILQSETRKRSLAINIKAIPGWYF